MEIKKGTKLIAIDPCEMDYENGNLTREDALIVGKEYTVLGFVTNEYSEGIIIQSEISDNHYFQTVSLKDYFTFPENNPDNYL